MIYAIEAVGSGFIKFGRAAQVSRRLNELATACPHELHILAVADWPDGAETAVHRILAGDIERAEWFKDGENARRVIGWMQANDLVAIREACAQLAPSFVQEKQGATNLTRTAKAIALAGAREAQRPAHQAVVASLSSWIEDQDRISRAAADAAIVALAQAENPFTNQGADFSDSSIIV